MAVSDAILKRLLQLHPKIIDLGLERMHRILSALGNPQDAIGRVIHVAGTNGKGSTIAMLQAILEDAGLCVHAYTSPHLVRFHERIRLASGPGQGKLIDEDELTGLLSECEEANRGEPITFFEITTAAAFLAFSRHHADYVLLETGLGGRLDATNVIDRPGVSVITSIGLDHQQFLGDTLDLIAREKAGIMKPGIPCVVAPQPDEAGVAIEDVARQRGTPLFAANQDWQTYEQHGRMIYQDTSALLDLPLPGLAGRHQMDNAGCAIAALRCLDDKRVSDQNIAAGISRVKWPARLERLESGALARLAPPGSEIWLDGGHNPAAGRALAHALAELNDKNPKPVILITGMLNTKNPLGFFESFEGLASLVITIDIPGEENSLSAGILQNIASQAMLDAITARDLRHALMLAGKYQNAPRIVICGSLYLAGNVLALNAGETPSCVTGTTRK